MALNSPRTRPNEERADAVTRFAHRVQHGQHSRNARFNYHGEDITAEVLAAAGPETDDENALFEIEEQRRFPWRLAGAIQELLADVLDNRWTHHYVGENFDVDLEDEDDGQRDYLILVRKRDGRRFHVEVSVDVQELS
jgi:hypothetical protein